MGPGAPQTSLSYPNHTCMHVCADAHVHSLYILKHRPPPPHSHSPNLCLPFSHSIVPQAQCSPALWNPIVVSGTSWLFSLVVSPSDQRRSALVSTLCSKQGQPPPLLSPGGLGPLPCCFPSQAQFCLDLFLILRIKHRTVIVLKLTLNLLSEKPKVSAQDISKKPKYSKGKNNSNRDMDLKIWGKN